MQRNLVKDTVCTAKSTFWNIDYWNQNCIDMDNGHLNTFLEIFKYFAKQNKHDQNDTEISS